MYPRVTRLYFGGMARYFAELRSILRPGARLAYVVGDQASYLRVMIRTDRFWPTWPSPWATKSWASTCSGREWPPRPARIRRGSGVLEVAGLTDGQRRLPQFFVHIQGESNDVSLFHKACVPRWPLQGAFPSSPGARCADGHAAVAHQPIRIVGQLDPLARTQAAQHATTSASGTSTVRIALD